ncbi:MAG: L-threonylcarbamoyladenylate synthase [Succinivibrio sp.]
MSAVFTRSLEEASATLKKGGVIVCPSEGVYGISCSLECEDAIARIIDIKKRDMSKGLIIVADNLSHLLSRLDGSYLTQKTLDLMARHWPGPHTFVLRASKNFQSRAVRPDHTVAVRVTAFEPLSQLCSLSSSPLISTSANISGKNAVTSIEMLDEEIVANVDLVLDLPCGGQSEPTSIYDTLTGTLVRSGPFWKE